MGSVVQGLTSRVAKTTTVANNWPALPIVANHPRSLIDFICAKQMKKDQSDFWVNFVDCAAVLHAYTRGSWISVTRVLDRVHPRVAELHVPGVQA
jgi:hypothetical protein